MTTPPRPDRHEYESALHRIHARRRAAGDDHPLALSEDPREVLTYLRQRGRSGLVADHTGDDITDALTLRLWLWWEGESAELWLLEAAEALGRNRKTVGAVLGLAHGQSLVDRIGRGRTRIGREPTATATQAEPGPVDDQVRELAAGLVARRGEMPEDVADGFEVDELIDVLPRWTADKPPPSEGVLNAVTNAVRFLLGDLVNVVPAGTDLRALVDRGVELVGTRSVV